MTFARLLIITAALCLAPSSLPAQQREVNDSGGSLTSNGANPTPGTPFTLTSNSRLDLEVGGTPGAGYTLVLGQLAASSTQIPPLANQFFDLDTSSAVIFGNGLGGGGALPGSFFFLDILGQSTWSFPLTPAAVGLRIAFQAIVFDPALTPGNLNLTAAPEFVVTNGIQLTGSSVATFAFPSGAYPMYGSSYSVIDVSTSGWIRFGGGANGSDPMPQRTPFLNGTVGLATASAPVVAPVWSFLEFNAPGAAVIASEVAPRVTRIDWVGGVNAMFPLGSVGTFRTTIDATSGPVLITMDFTGFVSANLGGGGPIGFPPSEISGVTDGGVAGATVNEVDLAVNNAVNPFNPSSVATIFQDFGFTGVFAEAVDFDNVVLSFLDANGAGVFSLF